jgi:hypothetical protein
MIGGDAFDSVLEFNTPQTFNRTTRGVARDFSNYWAPYVYPQEDNVSFINVEQVGDVNIYQQCVISFLLKQ